MAKFKIRMRLQGLELDIEGAREDIPAITQNLGQQLSLMLEPAGAIVEGRSPDGPPGAGAKLAGNATVSEPAQRKRGRRAAPRSSSAGDDAGAEPAVEWTHDPAKYGSPSQGWSTGSKALWLIYVAGEVTGTKELSGGRIAATFNQHFKQAGMITSSNVNRDLGRYKMKSGALVGEDTTKSPPQWFLTDAGRTKAQALVAGALGRT